MNAGQTEDRTLADFKGKPEHILPALLAIKKGGKWETIRSRIVASLQDMGSTAKEDNLVSAYVTPTLKSLRLTEFEGPRIDLTPDGVQCVEAFEQGGMQAYKRRLGIQLLEIDDETAKLVTYLNQHHSSIETATTLPLLKKELGGKIKRIGSQTALRGWIDHLSYVGLMGKTDHEFYLLTYEVDNTIRGEKNVGQVLFEREVRKAYEGLVSSGRRFKYVPIPKLRDRVCKKLQISQIQFYKRMSRMYLERSPGVVFSTPRGRRVGGLQVGKKYYYYVSIFESD